MEIANTAKNILLDASCKNCRFLFSRAPGMSLNYIDHRCLNAKRAIKNGEYYQEIGCARGFLCEHWEYWDYENK